MCLLFIPPCACLPPKRIHCFLWMHNDSALVRKSENGAHRGIWSHQMSVMYSAPCVEMTSFSVALMDALKPTETWDWIFYICSNTNLRIMCSYLWYHVWKCRHAQSSSRQYHILSENVCFWMVKMLKPALKSPILKCQSTLEKANLTTNLQLSIMHLIVYNYCTFFLWIQFHFLLLAYVHADINSVVFSVFRIDFVLMQIYRDL